MVTPLRDELDEVILLAKQGDSQSLAKLVDLLYRDFRVIAARRLKSERRGHTLGPTALLHEALIKILKDSTIANATGRSFLYQAASKAMRQVLIDHERKRSAQKGPGRLNRNPLEIALEHLSTVEKVSVLELREALDDLEKVSQRAAMCVRLQFLLGMSQAEVAETMEISQKTVEREWKFARGWLFERLKPSDDT